MPGHLPHRVFGRYQTVQIKKGFIMQAHLELEHPRQQIAAHKHIGDHGKAVGYLIIPDGYHGTTRN